MLKSEFEKIKLSFNKYINMFSLSKNKLILDPNMHLKFAHTKRVCKLMNCLADSVLADKNEKYTALTIALLHDIGRFYQLKFYQTFSDTNELDHAKIGVEIIKDQNMITHVSEDEKDIIYTAITYHNVKELPANIPPHIIPFANLIRDADKLDIIKVAIDYFQEVVQKKTLHKKIICEVSSEEYCSQKIIDDVLEHRVVSFTDINTIFDEMLMHLSWIESLTYLFSVKYFLNAGYINFILSILPEKTRKSGIDEYVRYIHTKYDTL